MRAERRAIFCRQLKAAREKSGVSLEAIAATTKIRRALFADLERGDLSRWPKGVYRRAYLRAYLRAIDLNDDATVDEFGQLFPDENDPAPALNSDLAKPALRLTLADDRAEAFNRLRARLVTAALDLAIVGFVWTMATLGSGVDVRTVGVIIALAYFTCATVWVGRSPASELMEMLRWKSVRPAALPTPEQGDMPEAPERIMTDALS